MSGSRPDPIYVAARRVLLDALGGLAPFRDAIILIGAQAIYLHTGEAGLAVPPYTTDADLALNPELLVPNPKLDATMRPGRLCAGPRSHRHLAASTNAHVGRSSRAGVPRRPWQTRGTARTARESDRPKGTRHRGRDG
jgi:hypothetical protein